MNPTPSALPTPSAPPTSPAPDGRVNQWTGVVTVRSIRAAGKVLRLAKIPCGKTNCHKCPHGPYWYFEFWSRGKWRHRYIGKSLDNPHIARDPLLAKAIDAVLQEARIDGRTLSPVATTG